MADIKNSNHQSIQRKVFRAVMMFVPGKGLALSGYEKKIM